MSHLTQMAGLAVHNFVSAAWRGGRGGAHPRARAPAHAHARQLLGRPRAHDDPHPRAARDRLHARAREPGRGPELPRRAHGHDGHRSEADDPGRPDREPGSDQGDRRERRRPVQRQLRAPVREPQPDHEHAPDLDAARDPVRVPVDVREDGGQREAGHRGAQRDVRAVVRDLDDRDGVRDERQPQAHRGRRQSAHDGDPIGRQHGGQGGPVRARPPRVSSRRRPPAPPPARSTPSTTASRPSAARRRS